MQEKQSEPKPFTDAGAALKELLAVIAPFLELHRAGSRGEHDRQYDKLYAFAERLDASEFRSPVVHTCHTVGADAISGGYLTFTDSEGRSISHAIDLYGAAALLRAQLQEPLGRLGEEKKALLAELEAKLAGLP